MDREMRTALLIIGVGLSCFVLVALPEAWLAYLGKMLLYLAAPFVIVLIIVGASQADNNWPGSG